MLRSYSSNTEQNYILQPYCVLLILIMYDVHVIRVLRISNSDLCNSRVKSDNNNSSIFTQQTIHFILLIKKYMSFTLVCNEYFYNKYSLRMNNICGGFLWNLFERECNLSNKIFIICLFLFNQIIIFHMNRERARAYIHGSIG